jgi:hypothetical protein
MNHTSQPSKITCHPIEPSNQAAISHIAVNSAAQRRDQLCAEVAAASERIGCPLQSMLPHLPSMLLLQPLILF